MRLMNMLPIALLATAVACSSDLGTVGDDDDDDDVVQGPDAASVDDPDATAVVDDGRVDLGLQAEWRFKTGAGTRIEDTSGVEPRVDFIIQDPLAVAWLPGGGIDITQETLILGTGPATKIHGACTANSQVTMEAWFQTAAVNQEGPARIVTYSIDTANRNFSLGQNNAEYNFRLRTTDTDVNGTPATATELGSFTSALTHVVVTRDLAQTIVYVDGEVAGAQALGGSFAQWDPLYQLALGNEITGDRPWRGQIYLVAVYCRSLSSLEVKQNFEAGW